MANFGFATLEAIVHPMNDEEKHTVAFGYRDVAPEEKPALVREIFSSVARRYDLMNDLMSAGVHRLWKDQFVDWLNPQPGMAVLDVAGGTGDIAFRIATRTRAKGEQAKITVCDINLPMLEQGRRRPAATCSGRCTRTGSRGRSRARSSPTAPRSPTSCA